MSEESERDELNRLRAENEELRARTNRGVYLKVGEKGGVSLYGLGRFPITLYQEQWLKVLDMGEEIRTFIKQHKAELKSKQDR